MSMLMRTAAAVSASVGFTLVLASILGFNSGGVSFAMEKMDTSALFDPKQFNPVCPIRMGCIRFLRVAPTL